MARDGGEPLCRPEVRASAHRNTTVRPRLRGAPLDRVLAVGDLLQERIELALRIAEPADVLDHHRPAAARECDGVKTGASVSA
jgi:hypothetical protein